MVQAAGKRPSRKPADGASQAPKGETTAQRSAAAAAKPRSPPASQLDARPRSGSAAAASANPAVHRTAAAKKPKKSTAAKHQQQPKPKIRYEWGGPVGSFFLMLMLPSLLFGFYFACNENGCLSLWPEDRDYLRVPSLPAFEDLWSAEAFAVAIGWFLWLVVLYYVLPGRTAYGLPLEDGSRLAYPMNGLLSVVVSYAAVIAGVYLGYISPTYLYDHFLQLLSAVLVLCLCLSVYLYVRSIIQYDIRNPKHSKFIAKPGRTGNHVYDFWIGRTLNPREGSFDWKTFCELRPGLVGWTLINFSCAAKQYELLGTVSASMVLVLVFQTWYVLESLIHEENILTTMDVVTDGFGFMLVHGDLAWVPFSYSLQARYLVTNPTVLSWSGIAFIVALNMFGYWIFRSANNQKNLFRSNPNHPSVKKLQSIKTARGTRLLADGWWGMARHINYLGDILMGLAWCLPCGFGHPLPYYYFFYFTTLLVHRELRDEHKCSEKYGKDWKEYCKRVPYRILPGVY